MDIATNPQWPLSYRQDAYNILITRSAYSTNLRPVVLSFLRLRSNDLADVAATGQVLDAIDARQIPVTSPSINPTT